MSAIEITRQDLSVSRLRAEAARTADAKQARRILAIAMVLDGYARRLAAQACGMDRQTLRDWVIRYNAEGFAGRADRPRPGRRAAAAARTARQTGWCAGAVPICVTVSPRTLASACMSVVSASCCTRSISVASRCARFIRKATSRRRRLLKKLRRAGMCRDPAAACRPAG